MSKRRSARGDTRQRASTDLQGLEGHARRRQDCVDGGIAAEADEVPRDAREGPVQGLLVLCAGPRRLTGSLAGPGLLRGTKRANRLGVQGTLRPQGAARGRRAGPNLACLRASLERLAPALMVAIRVAKHGERRGNVLQITNRVLSIDSAAVSARFSACEDGAPWVGVLRGRCTSRPSGIESENVSSLRCERRCAIACSLQDVGAASRQLGAGSASVAGTAAAAHLCMRGTVRVTWGRSHLGASAGWARPRRPLWRDTSTALRARRPHSRTPPRLSRFAAPFRHHWVRPRGPGLPRRDGATLNGPRFDSRWR